VNQSLTDFILEMSGIESDTLEFKKLKKIIENSQDYETAIARYKQIKNFLKKQDGFYESQFFRLLKVYYDPYLNFKVQKALSSFQLPDIPGDLHVHTNWSDGTDTIEEMVEYATKFGYKYIAITDHTFVGKGKVQMNEDKFLRQLSEIEKLQEKHKIKILKSAEIDVNEDGSLDYSKEILKLMDFVMVSIHFDYGGGIKKVIELFEKITNNEYVDMVAHPLNKLEIEEFKRHGEKILDLFEKNGKIIEFNLFPDRIKENDLLLEMIKNRNVMVSFSTDSHRRKHLEFMKFSNFWLKDIKRENIYNYSFLN